MFLQTCINLNNKNNKYSNNMEILFNTIYNLYRQTLVQIQS